MCFGKFVFCCFDCVEYRCVILFGFVYVDVEVDFFDVWIGVVEFD